MLYLKKDQNETPIKILGLKVQELFAGNRNVVHYTRDSFLKGWSSDYPLDCSMGYLESDKATFLKNWNSCLEDIQAIGQYLLGT